MAYTIEEMNNNMTIFYYKSNGDIYSACSGIQDINVFFGTHSVDIMQIVSSIVLPIDNFVLQNIRQFKIDIIKIPEQLVMLPQVNQYPIASQ